ncbi:hypothetical protein MKEN_00006600 [Mycena kentingensis (nom. inval.)]|nr:hypothetical protein MKEN_00006600 [Mycena kentingensis (nom. inval.)]
MLTIDPYAQHHQLLAPSPSPPHPAYGDSSTPPPGPSAAKRYRSAPAKTFQCSGYGDCAMVFSRSEHLARHIRKHTGERPFQCHCGKQFSRLDNLRQHAQTVHSTPEEKPLNERMMRALAGINASMLAGVRGRRRFQHTGISLDPSSVSPPLGSPVPMMYSPSYSSASGSSPSSSSSSDAYEYSEYEEAAGAHGHGHQLYAAYAAGCYPSGSHSLPASPSYPSFPVGVQQQQYTTPSPPTYHHTPSSLARSHQPYVYPQTAPLLATEAEDYLSAGLMAAAAVKQEQVDVDLSGVSPDFEEFYRAVCAPPPASLSPPLSSSSGASPSPPQSPTYFATPGEAHSPPTREMSNAEYYAQYYYAEQQQHEPATHFPYA